MVDAGKIQSFADRILALKADEDEVKKQIREVYAEAIEAEIDKTGLGQLVTHLRKRGKSPEDFDAKEAIFLGYLELYNVALSGAHAYARARTGEIIEPNSTPPASQEQTADPAGEAASVPSPPKGEAQLQSAPADTESTADVAQLAERPICNGQDAGSTPAVSSSSRLLGTTAPPPAAAVGTSLAGAEGDEDRQPNSEPGDGQVGATPIMASEPATGEASAPASPVVPTAADNARKIRPWCLHADDLTKCGGYGLVTCHPCLKAHADAEGIAA